MTRSRLKSPARLRAVLLTTAAVSFSLASGPARGGEITLDGKVFTLPEGFVLEKIAGPPLVDRPITADFDEQGRLYVADSSGSNDPVQKQLQEKPHRILRLEDSDGDGKFDRRTVFADRLMFPEGTMWFDGSLYVSAPPSIWKLTDTDGDGVADRREEWFDGKTLTGCANDLHGPYLGPDGWIYWCKGAFARQTYERPGKPPFVTRASHIFRRRPDGAGIEPVLTGGMDNPVDVVFTPGGERVLSNTFIQHPAGGKRDGLLHAVYGGVYGKVHDVLDGHPRTGPDVMPILTHLGPAAACGMTRMEADTFGPEFRDNLFVCCFNLQKISRVELTPQGAGFASKDTDFLVAQDRDFHPTDILDDADGSLVVVDTGGWYKLCCPTSQLQKPDVLGAIYRVKKSGGSKLEDPRGLKLAWETLTPDALAGLLGDPRPAVRKRAIHVLARAGGKAVPALRKVLHEEKSVEARRNAVWALCRMDHPDARPAAREGLADFDETVRQVAAHAASVRQDREATQKLVSLLMGPSAQNRRVAAEALGRLGDTAVVPALLSAAGQADPADRMLEHSITYALIEIGNPDATALALKSSNPRTRRAALVAIDQMEGGKLDPADVASGLASDDPAARETASWIVGRHPEWADALAGFLRQRIETAGLSEVDRAALVDQLARFARSSAVQKLIGDKLAGIASNDAAARRAGQVALRAIAASGLKEVPAEWVDGLIAGLKSGNEEAVRDSVATAKAVSAAAPKARAAALASALVSTGMGKGSTPVATRIDALAAVPGGLNPVTPELFDFLLAQLDPDNAVAVRGAAAGVLGRAALGPEQLSKLADAVKRVGPLEVERLLAAFERSTDEAAALRLLASLKESAVIGACASTCSSPGWKSTARR
ncbi:MAG: PVC-type heme-binding CxxCH protein [Isosphaeraceae bacterium]